MRLEMITPENVGGACRLAVKPEQEKFVAPVAVSLAEAYASRATAWPRLVYDGDLPVGFVMGAFDPANEIDFFRCGIWRLNVSAEHQGKGVGRFAVDGVLDEARRRGERRATVLWLRCGCPVSTAPGSSTCASGSGSPARHSTVRPWARSRCSVTSSRPPAGTRRTAQQGRSTGPATARWWYPSW